MGIIKREKFRLSDRKNSFLDGACVLKFVSWIAELIWNIIESHIRVWASSGLVGIVMWHWFVWNGTTTKRPLKYGILAAVVRIIMTSRHRNALQQSTSHRLFTRIKCQWWRAFMFSLLLPGPTVEYIVEVTVIWAAMTLLCDNGVSDNKSLHSGLTIYVVKLILSYK